MRTTIGFDGCQANAATRLALRVACLVCVLFTATLAEALDPEKRLTQYLHTAWRIEDGSAPAGALSIAQTPDGYLWFSAFTQDLY